MGLKRLWHRLRDALHEDGPKPYIWCYLKSGTTLRGTLVGRDREAYILDHADVATEGMTSFRQLRERVRIPREAVDYYTTGGR